MSQRIYVAEFKSCVKIGISRNPAKRIESFENTNGKAINCFWTDEMPEAGDKEKLIHSSFNDKRIHGEFFEIRFCDAVAMVKNICSIREDFKPEPINDSLPEIFRKQLVEKKRKSNLSFNAVILLALEEYLEKHQSLESRK